MFESRVVLDGSQTVAIQPRCFSEFESRVVSVCTTTFSCQSLLALQFYCLAVCVSC